MSPNKAEEYLQILSPEKLAEIQTENPFIRLSDAVYRILESAILSSSLKPGSKINLSRIAEALNISDTPVREAVELLAVNGLLTETTGGKGKYKSYSVFDIDETDMTMLFDMRKAIESTSAYFCAEDNRNLDMRALLSVTKKFQEALEHYRFGAAPQAAEYDRAYHTMIVEATGNKYLIEMYHTVGKNLKYLSARSCDFMPNEQRQENFYRMGRQHLAICNAIEQGFPDMARSLMDAHLDFCYSCIIKNKKHSYS